MAILKYRAHSVAVEMADTPEARAIGLGGHAPLEDGQGMLFSFPTRGRFPFWMKGMTFAIGPRLCRRSRKSKTDGGWIRTRSSMAWNRGSGRDRAGRWLDGGAGRR